MNPVRAVFPAFIEQPSRSGEAGAHAPTSEVEVGAGLSPGMAGGGPSLLVSMGVALLMLPSVGAAPASWEAPEFSDPALQLLSRYTQRLVQTQAADQGWVGEWHQRPGNLARLTATWSGALSAGAGEVSVWRELNKNNAGKEEQLAAAMRDPAARARGAVPLANAIARLDAKRPPSTRDEKAQVQYFQDVMTHPNATVQVLCFFNPALPSLSRFIGSPGVGLASVGFRHAEDSPVPDDTTIDRVARTRVPLPREYRASVVGQERQNDMWDGLRRSRNAGHHPFYVAGEEVVARRAGRPTEEQRGRFIDQHLAEGGGVMELVSDSGNITVVVGPEAVAVSKQFARENPGEAFFTCGTLPGCADAPAAKLHDEA